MTHIKVTYEPWHDTFAFHVDGQPIIQKFAQPMRWKDRLRHPGRWWRRMRHWHQRFRGKHLEVTYSLPVDGAEQRSGAIIHFNADPPVRLDENEGLALDWTKGDA